MSDHGKDPEGLPPGRMVTLDGRGDMYVRSLFRPGKPTLVLLHGWVGTSGSNWFRAFPSLLEDFSVVAPDHRGHGQGIRSRGRFRLADCADDVVALLETMQLDDVVLVGYSMGGPIAQLTWQRAPERVAGLVLASTAFRFVSSQVSRLAVTSIVPAVAQVTRATEVISKIPLAGMRRFLPPMLSSDDSLAAWGAGQMRSHDIRHLVEAGLAIGTYDARPWIGDIDVPTAVVVTAKDRAVDVSAQLELALRIPNATVHTVADGHLGVLRPEFCEALRDACIDVAERSGLIKPK